VNNLLQIPEAFISLGKNCQKIAAAGISPAGDAHLALVTLTRHNNIVIMTGMVWEIEYLETAKGRLPVQEFIDSLDTRSKAKIARTLDLLEQFGIKLGGCPMPSMWQET
jgi:hypothetical protein